MFTEEDLIPISALQHWIFCPRQWGLIHLEQIWTENHLTAEGRILHEKVDIPNTESRSTVNRVTSVHLRSLRYGLTGIADVLELYSTGEHHKRVLLPVEYKRGKPKEDLSDQTQLCAQALCLEEMLKTSVNRGAIYYGEIKRRQEVEFTDELRSYTISVIHQIHKAAKEMKTPQGTLEKKCASCSLFESCMPKCLNQTNTASKYLKDIIINVDRLLES